MPRHSHSRGDGLGFAASQRQESCHQRVSLAAVGRLNRQLADARNVQVAQLAQKIVVAYASSGGSLAALLAQWREVEHQVDLLSDSPTAHN